MSRHKKVLAIALCITLLFSYATYRVITNRSPLPDIIVVAYGQETEKTKRLKDEIGEGTIHDIQSMVTSSVAEDLTAAGFSCGDGIAYTIENDDYAAAGLYYYDSGLQLFESSELQSVGFVQIVSDTVKYEEPSSAQSVITVVPSDDSIVKHLICTYSYENIVSDHFVYQGYYVSYYQQSPMRVVYSITENITSNYDFTLGSLYDYDHERFIYDRSILGEYQSHSAIPLFSETDYLALEAELQEVSEQQLLNGYYVSEYRIVYISPESVQAYLDSKEEDTFFGYGTRELTEAFGYGTALAYTENGFQSAKIIEENESYNWKSFLTKVGIGCGVLIVGAILAPVTGGASFGCALITATKITVGASLCAGLGTLAIETAMGLANGKGFEEALHDASHKGLDTFANTFLITSVVASVGVASGAIKPSACFVAGTRVIVGIDDGHFVYLPIESISLGDRLLSWNHETRENEIKTVSSIYKREVAQTLRLVVNGTAIETTKEHPFWNVDINNWCKAETLVSGSRVLLADGDYGVVEESILIEHSAPVTVYNFEVEDNHTYYVGISGILVHNQCDSMFASERSKAVRDAWKREAEAVKNGVSKYNWTSAEKTQLLKFGKIRGYEGHHIKTVKELAGTAKEYLISSADDIVFLTKQNHAYVHPGGFKNPTDINRLVELLPWVVERLPALGF